MTADPSSHRRGKRRPSRHTVKPQDDHSGTTTLVGGILTPCGALGLVQVEFAVTDSPFWLDQLLARPDKQRDGRLLPPGTLRHFITPRFHAALNSLCMGIVYCNQDDTIDAGRKDTPSAGPVCPAPIVSGISV